MRTMHAEMRNMGSANEGESQEGVTSGDFATSPSTIQVGEGTRASKGPDATVRVRVGDQTSTSTPAAIAIRLEPASPAAPVPQALSDYQWFFADPRRVKRFAGAFVVVARKRVVGHGTVREAMEAAKARGVLHPLLIDLRHIDKSGNRSADL